MDGWMEPVFHEKVRHVASGPAQNLHPFCIFCACIPWCSCPDSPGSWCPVLPCRLADRRWLSGSRWSLVGWSALIGCPGSTGWSAAWSPPRLQAKANQTLMHRQLELHVVAAVWTELHRNQTRCCFLTLFQFKCKDSARTWTQNIEIPPPGCWSLKH